MISNSTKGPPESTHRLLTFRNPHTHGADWWIQDWLLVRFREHTVTQTPYPARTASDPWHSQSWRHHDGPSSVPDLRYSEGTTVPSFARAGGVRTATPSIGAQHSTHLIGSTFIWLSLRNSSDCFVVLWAELHHRRGPQLRHRSWYSTNSLRANIWQPGATFDRVTQNAPTREAFALSCGSLYMLPWACVIRVCLRDWPCPRRARLQ